MIEDNRTTEEINAQINIYSQTVKLLESELRDARESLRIEKDALAVKICKFKVGDRFVEKKRKKSGGDHWRQNYIDIEVEYEISAIRGDKYGNGSAVYARKVLKNGSLHKHEERIWNTKDIRVKK